MGLKRGTVSALHNIDATSHAHVNWIDLHVRVSNRSNDHPTESQTDRDKQKQTDRQRGRRADRQDNMNPYLGFPVSTEISVSDDFYRKKQMNHRQVTSRPISQIRLLQYSKVT